VQLIDELDRVLICAERLPAPAHTDLVADRHHQTLIGTGAACGIAQAEVIGTMCDCSIPEREESRGQEMQCLRGPHRPQLTLEVTEEAAHSRGFQRGQVVEELLPITFQSDLVSVEQPLQAIEVLVTEPRLASLTREAVVLRVPRLQEDSQALSETELCGWPPTALDEMGRDLIEEVSGLLLLKDAVSPPQPRHRERFPCG
jgi:hypothetical protein